jgi:hypothetical protein
MNPFASDSPLRPLAVIWRLKLGRPGLIGLLGLGVAAYCAWVWGPRLEHERAALQARATVAATQPAPAVRRTVAQLGASVLDALPPSSQRGSDLSRLIEISRRTEVELTRGDYTIEKLNAGNDRNGADGVTQWRLQLPVRGSYAQLRRFVAELLNGLPHAALDGLQIDRPDAQQPWVETTLRITFFYQGGS